MRNNSRDSGCECAVKEFYFQKSLPKRHKQNPRDISKKKNPNIISDETSVEIHDELLQRSSVVCSSSCTRTEYSQDELLKNHCKKSLQDFPKEFLGKHERHHWRNVCRNDRRNYWNDWFEECMKTLLEELLEKVSQELQE